ncbi:MAG: sigma-70 family RNA polymerase sigma factor [Pseudonocardia sp.]|nr:sigma-70 family RNA polymerase sigma factor [Pseudonocardia sp.]
MEATGTDLLDDPLGRALAGGLRELARLGRGTLLGASPAALRGGRTSRVARRGDELAGLIDRLYREQHDGLLRYALRRIGDRARAEDVVQRSYERVWRRAPDPADLDNPVAYLVTATRNEINRELRRLMTERERSAPAGDDGTAPEPSGGDAPPDVAGQVIDRVALAEALGALSPREREAVVLRLQWQLSVEEAAQVMSVSAGAVKSYTHHGLRNLRSRWAA